MYRLLIVDDEAGHREGMIGLLRMLKPEYLVFEAESGERALQIMCTMSFDLVLTDIRMSGMDGLTFLQAAKMKQPRARFAILSAYGTFEYAQRGISIGADEYLLKPVDIGELRLCLDKMENHLWDTQLAQQEQTRIQSNLLNMQISYVEQQMYSFVMGELPREEEAGVRQIFGGGDAGVMLYMEPQQAWRSLQARSDVRFEIRRYLKRFGSAVVFCPGNNINALACMLTCETLHIDEQALAQMESLIQEATGERLIIGWCAKEAGFFVNLYDLYQRAYRACLRHFFKPEAYLLCADAEATLNHYQSARLDVSLRDLASAIELGEENRAFQMLQSPLQSMARDGNVYPSKLKEAVMYAFMFLLSDAQMHLEERAQERISRELDVLVPESQSFEELLDSIRRVIGMFCEEIASIKTQKHAMDDVVRYIQEHFQEPLSLAEAT